MTKFNMITDKPVLSVDELHNLHALEIKELQRYEEGITTEWTWTNSLNKSLMKTINALPIRGRCILDLIR